MTKSVLTYRLTIIGLCGLLVLSNTYWVLFSNRTTTKYRQAVLCATVNGLTVVDSIRSGKDPVDNLRKANELVEFYRLQEMKDKKTAMVLDELSRALDEGAPSLSAANARYVDEVITKWSGEEVGFPDHW